MDVNQDKQSATENEGKHVAGDSKIETNQQELESQPEAVDPIVEDAPDEEVIDIAIKKAQQQADEFKDKFMRKVAEMDNLRKRHDKERSDLLKYGNEKILGDLLPILDSFAKAVTVEDEEAKTSYVEGIKMVYDQLDSVLTKHGLESFDSAGEDFDPNRHQAIQKIDDDSVSTEIVKDEFQKGYLLNDRLLRPAIVSVAVPTAKD